MVIEPNTPATVSGCFHCGETLDSSAVNANFRGETHTFCCTGCAGAAEWIATAGLADYYRLRQAEGGRVEDVDEEELRLWDRPEIQAEHVHVSEQGSQVTVLTDGMRCAACAWLIDRALSKQAGVKEINANAVTGRIRIVWDANQNTLSSILAALSSLGYRAHLSPGQAQEQARHRARRSSILRLGVAGLGAMQAMMFAEALYLDTAQEMSIPMRDFLRWITFLLSTPVVFYSGWPFISGMWNELRLRRFGMDTLIATSVLLAYFASFVEILRGGVHVWFDAAVMFVLFLLIAREIETAARSRATNHVDTLARARPAFAHKEVDEDIQRVPVAALKVGDVVRVSPGDAVPADGIALDAGEFDESLLTGESVAVPHVAGDELRAGSTVIGKTARLRVTRSGQDTWISQLTRLIERAQDERPGVAKLADKVASRFVVVMFITAALTCVWWINHEPSRAFEVTLAVLVVACPCALSLAIPAAISSAHSALARAGVLALRPDALDTLARVDTVVFDKTGTLTRGLPELLQLEVLGALSRERVLQVAWALERDSQHPLARVFQRQSGFDPLAAGAAWADADIHHIPGAGVEAQVEGQTWRLGHAAFASGAVDDDAVWLGDGKQAFARFVIADGVRPEAHAALSAVHALGLNTELLSGDSEEAVSEVAIVLGITLHHSRQTPEQKLQRIRALQQQGRVVLMVGDGINDAPVLSGADVSIALHSGAALAHGAADFVLTGHSLMRVPEALALARRSRRIMRQNLMWALGYNAVALPLAAAGWVAPWLAALGMAVSSLIVTLNALRLIRAKPNEQDESTWVVK